MKRGQIAELQASGIQTSLLGQAKLKTPSLDLVPRKMKRRMKNKKQLSYCKPYLFSHSKFKLESLYSCVNHNQLQQE